MRRWTDYGLGARFYGNFLTQTDFTALWNFLLVCNKSFPRSLTLPPAFADLLFKADESLAAQEHRLRHNRRPFRHGGRLAN